MYMDDISLYFIATLLTGFLAAFSMTILLRYRFKGDRSILVISLFGAAFFTLIGITLSLIPS